MSWVLSTDPTRVLWVSTFSPECVVTIVEANGAALSASATDLAKLRRERFTLLFVFILVPFSDAIGRQVLPVPTRD